MASFPCEDAFGKRLQALQASISARKCLEMADFEKFDAPVARRDGLTPTTNIRGGLSSLADIAHCPNSMLLQVLNLVAGHDREIIAEKDLERYWGRPRLIQAG